MEKQKKKLSKKAVVICSVVLVVLVVGGVLIYKLATREKLYTFDEITNGLSEQVSYVVDADGDLTQEEIDEIYERYKTLYFVELTEENLIPWNGIGEITNHLLFYDNNDILLFSISKRRYSCLSVLENGNEFDYQMIIQ